MPCFSNGVEGCVQQRLLANPSSGGAPLLLLIALMTFLSETLQKQAHGANTKVHITATMWTGLARHGGVSYMTAPPPLLCAGIPQSRHAQFQNVRVKSMERLTSFLIHGPWIPSPSLMTHMSPMRSMSSIWSCCAVGKVGAGPLLSWPKTVLPDLEVGFQQDQPAGPQGVLAPVFCVLAFFSHSFRRNCCCRFRVELWFNHDESTHTAGSCAVSISRARFRLLIVLLSFLFTAFLSFGILEAGQSKTKRGGGGRQLVAKAVST